MMSHAHLGSFWPPRSEVRRALAAGTVLHSVGGGAVVVGCVAAVVLLMIHTYLAPMHLEEQRYIGVLFLVASVLLAGVAGCLVVPALLAPVWWLGRRAAPRASDR